MIVKAGYLVRTAAISGGVLHLTGVELIHEPTGAIQILTFKSGKLQATKNTDGKLGATLAFVPPKL